MKTKIPNTKTIHKFKQRIGRNIKFIRLNSGDTAEEFAKKLHIPRIHLFRLENAKAKAIDYNFIYNLGKRLTDLDRLFREDIAETTTVRNNELFLNRKGSKEWKEV